VPDENEQELFTVNVIPDDCDALMSDPAETKIKAWHEEFSAVIEKMSLTPSAYPIVTDEPCSKSNILIPVVEMVAVPTSLADLPLFKLMPPVNVTPFWK
jgi:hypothetical protein